jgi:hypothetical protein
MLKKTKAPRMPGQKRVPRKTPLIETVTEAVVVTDPQSPVPVGFRRVYAIYDQRSESYYAGRTAIGPRFGATEKSALFLSTERDAQFELFSHSFAFVFSVVRLLDVKDKQAEK